MKFRILAMVLFLMPSLSHAVEVDIVPDIGAESPVDVKAISLQPWLVSAHFSYLDMMVPAKIGFAVARGESETSSFELEYTHGSFAPFFISDLGKFSEERISFVERTGSNNLTGFQLFYGIFYHRFKLHIGSALMNRLTTYYPSADLLSISGIGGMVGIGYRWRFGKSFLIGIDAVTYSQPIITLSREAKFLDVVSDPGDREKVEVGITAMQYFPRLALAKIAIGYVF